MGVSLSAVRQLPGSLLETPIPSALSGTGPFRRSARGRSFPKTTGAPVPAFSPGNYVALAAALAALLLPACSGSPTGPSQAPSAQQPPAQQPPVSQSPADPKPAPPDAPALRQDAQKPPEKPPEKPPVVVSAEQLAQELHDDINTAYRRYGLIPLQVQGVVHKRMEDKGAIHMIQFLPPNKDRKTGTPVELVIFCGLQPPIPVGDKTAADLAVGKKVTIRGTMFAAGNGQATLGPCTLVRD